MPTHTSPKPTTYTIKIRAHFSRYVIHEHTLRQANRTYVTPVLPVLISTLLHCFSLPPSLCYCSPLPHLLVLTAAGTLKMRTHSKHFSFYYPTQALAHYRHTREHICRRQQTREKRNLLSSNQNYKTYQMTVISGANTESEMATFGVEL